MRILTKEDLNNSQYSLSYNDIGIVPTIISSFSHRNQADTRINFAGVSRSLPIISSPMKHISGIKMVQTLQLNGCIGLLNRFNEECIEYRNSFPFYAIGLDEEPSSEIIDIVCIDTANAHNMNVLDRLEILMKKYPHDKFIVGNIAYDDGNLLEYYSDLGAYAIRVGIGSGSMCSTSIRTGIGIGQVSSILSCYMEKKSKNLPIKIIADGGIRTTGDIVKALACGADMVMLGRMLAGTDETPGEIIEKDGRKYKIYAGSASSNVKGNNSYIEGEETLVPYKGSVENVLKEIKDGLQSAMSYLGVYDLDGLREWNRFVLLSEHSFIERNPQK